MKTQLSLNLVMVLLLGGRLVAGPAVGNDGTTTTNLTQLSNLYGTGGATVSLASTNGVLVAAQAPIVADAIPVRTVWFLNTQAPTSGVYGVSADFKPAMEACVDSAIHRGGGGVIGWLDLNGRKGISLQVVPSIFGGYFQLATVDFLATDQSGNESFTNLFNLDGTPADFTSALSELGNYTPTNFATFQLDFAKPSAAELAVVSNATAHITAKVLQGDSGGAPVQLGRTIDLLTDLPAPGAGLHEHRAGYYAYWGSLLQEGSVIGELDNLELVEGFAPVTTNKPPQVMITAPATGTSATTPTELLITAEASDVDGLVEQVVFFDGATPLATNTAAPFSYDWPDVPVGAHILTAEATDDRGATTKSQPVTFTVLAPFNEPPTVSLLTPADGAVFTAPVDITLLADATDIDDEVSQVEFFWGGTNLIGISMNAPFSFGWTNVGAGTYSLTAKATDVGGASATSTNQVIVTVNTMPGERPALSIDLISPDNKAVQLSWSPQFTGYQLQWTTDLANPNWADSSGSTNNNVVFTISGAQTYFRLFRQ